jgi:hypothetical protein
MVRTIRKADTWHLEDGLLRELALNGGFRLAVLSTPCTTTPAVKSNLAQQKRRRSRSSTGAILSPDERSVPNRSEVQSRFHAAYFLSICPTNARTRDSSGPPGKNPVCK